MTRAASDNVCRVLDEHFWGALFGRELGSLALPRNAGSQPKAKAPCLLVEAGIGTRAPVEQRSTHHRLGRRLAGDDDGVGRRSMV